MAKKSLREQHIDSIMNTKFKDDDPKYDDSNRAFLESLDLKALQKLADHEFEDEFELEGEVQDIDFTNEEL